MLLGLAPGLEARAVHWLGVEMGRFKSVAVFDEFEMAIAGAVVLKVIGGVDAHGGDGETVLPCGALFLPIAVEVHMPFLQVGAGVDMGAEAAQLALFAHHAFEERTHVGMADQVAEVFGLAV